MADFTVDADRGKKVFMKVCSHCHSIEPNGKHIFGPNLHGMFGHKSGSIEGYHYSDAHKSLGVVWDKETLDAYLKDPNKYVPVLSRFHMAQDAKVYYNESYGSTLLKSLSSILEGGNLCDVTIVVGDRELNCHKIILAASIPYFRSMFTCNMVESTMSKITLKELDPTTLESLINYGYSGQLRITGDNVVQLLHDSTFLLLTDVQNACCDFLTDKLSKDNCFRLLQIAQDFACIRLRESSLRFIYKNFIQLSRTDEFKQLDLAQVKHLFGSDLLEIASEEQVFEALMEWIHYEEETRKEYVAELFSLIRLPLITPNTLADKIGKESLIQSNLICRDLLDEARDVHLMPERRTRIEAYKITPRCCQSPLGIIYVAGEVTLGRGSILESYDPVVNRWSPGMALPNMRTRAALCSLDKVIYAIGGVDGRDRVKTAEMYDTLRGEWKPLPMMNTQRSALSVAAVPDLGVFVLGGYSGAVSLNQCELYRLSTKKWEPLPCLSKQRSASGVVAVGDRVFAIGGHDGVSIFHSVEYLAASSLIDTDANPSGLISSTTSSSSSSSSANWIELAPLQMKRCRLGAAHINNRIYAVGGYDGSQFLTSVEYFDLEKQRWFEAKPLMARRCRLGVAASGGLMYAMAGCENNTNLGTVECYDPRVDRWHSVAPLTSVSGGCSATTVC